MGLDAQHSAVLGYATLGYMILGTAFDFKGTLTITKRDCTIDTIRRQAKLELVKRQAKLEIEVL